MSFGDWLTRFSSGSLLSALASSLKAIGFFVLVAGWLLLIAIATCLFIEYPVVFVRRDRVWQSYAAVAAALALVVLGLSVRDVRIPIPSMFSDQPWMYATELVFLATILVGAAAWLAASLILTGKWVTGSFDDWPYRLGIKAWPVDRAAPVPWQKPDGPPARP